MRALPTASRWGTLKVEVPRAAAKLGRLETSHVLRGVTDGEWVELSADLLASATVAGDAEEAASDSGGGDEPAAEGSVRLSRRQSSRRSSQGPGDGGDGGPLFENAAEVVATGGAVRLTWTSDEVIDEEGAKDLAAAPPRAPPIRVELTPTLVAPGRMPRRLSQLAAYASALAARVGVRVLQRLSSAEADADAARWLRGALLRGGLEATDEGGGRPSSPHHFSAERTTAEAPPTSSPSASPTRLPVALSADRIPELALAPRRIQTDLGSMAGGAGGGGGAEPVSLVRSASTSGPGLFGVGGMGARPPALRRLATVDSGRRRRRRRRR